MIPTRATIPRMKEPAFELFKIPTMQPFSVRLKNIMIFASMMIFRQAQSSGDAAKATQPIILSNGEELDLVGNNLWRCPNCERNKPEPIPLRPKGQTCPHGWTWGQNRAYRKRAKVLSSSPKPSQQWECPMCTYHNKAEVDKCAMCDSVQPSGPPKPIMVPPTSSPRPQVRQVRSQSPSSSYTPSSTLLSPTSWTPTPRNPQVEPLSPNLPSPPSHDPNRVLPAWNCPHCSEQSTGATNCTKCGEANWECPKCSARNSHTDLKCKCGRKNLMYRRRLMHRLHAAQTRGSA